MHEVHHHPLGYPRSRGPRDPIEVATSTAVTCAAQATLSSPIPRAGHASGVHMTRIGGGICGWVGSGACCGGGEHE
ncbi:hypothetical protein PSPO01_02183 [Paraphaeosphaeria sporulosa]